VQQYRRRLAGLDTAIEDAVASNDLARTESLITERDFLMREMSAAVGLGHRDRRLGDDRERARKAVTGRIKDAVGRITAAHPELGEHLSRTISTGYLCEYRPDLAARWVTAEPVESPLEKS